ncbi:putative response regulator [Collimonas arenae]|uniref:Putative response regulator n=1 Tax=Collimonas arenae TaxID=279058 RepID=A0A0A1FA86_9BURK|nr:putative response regulator [Collimonas arenae]
MLKGIKQELAAIETIKIVGAVRNSTGLIELLDQQACDVLVTDYAMPQGEYGDGLALFEFIQRRYPNIHIVVMTMMDNPAVLQTLLTVNIRCAVSKSDDSSHLVPAIHIAHSGGEYFSPTMNTIVQALRIGQADGRTTSKLTKREVEIVRLLVSGLTVNQIAERLSRSKQTVSSQKMNAMKKLGIERDVDLYKYATEMGLM